MADFLNFSVIDEIIDGTPKYTITDNADNTKSISLANTVITQGTALNKNTFDKLKIINSILGYNEITGIKTGSNLNYNLDFLSNVTLSNNQIIKVQPTNESKKNFTNWTINTPVSTGASLDTPYIKKLSNGNLFIIGSGSGNGYFMIYDSSGNVIKSSTSIGSNLYYPKALELDNGNIIIVGCNLSSNSGYCAVISSSGSVVTSPTSLGSYCLNPQLIQLDNGNIFILGCKSSGQVGYIYIVNESGTIVKSATSITGYYDTAKKLIKLDNGNVMAIGRDYINIFDQDGNLVKSTSLTTAYNYPDAIKLDNGSVMIVRGSDTNAYITIVDQSGNISLANKLVGSSCGNYPKISKINNNIVILGSTGYSSYTGYYVIVDQSGNIVKSQTSAGGMYDTSYVNTNILCLEDVGLALLIGYKYNYNSINISLIDDNGNFIKSTINISTDMRYPMAEIINDTIFIVGGASTIYLCLIDIIASLSVYLNNIEIDTILEKDKYYELMYDSTQTKFIAEEVKA